MTTKNLIDQIKSWEIRIPMIKEWVKIKGKVLKRVETWILIDCEDWAFTGLILPKEVKELERKWEDLSPWVEIEAEVLNPDLMEDEWYFIISISKLLQYDYWRQIVEKIQKDEVITVVPTEANLWWLLVDILWIKWFIPLSQLAPVNYPRVEDWDQEKIFDKIISLIWKEFKVRIINIDEDNKRMIFSEREALREEREEIMSTLDIWSEYEWVISWVSSYWLFVTIGGGIEWLVHISEITYGHVDSIDRFGKVWKKLKVKVIWLEDGKISLSIKQLKPDPWSLIPNKVKEGDEVTGEVIRFVPYGAFIRVFEDINWLIHLSEISAWKNISNPAEVLRLGQVVKARVILLDLEKRKIGLSIKWLNKEIDQQLEAVEKKAYKKPYKKFVKTEDNGTTEWSATPERTVKRVFKKEEPKKEEIKKEETPKQD